MKSFNIEMKISEENHCFLRFVKRMLLRSISLVAFRIVNLYFLSVSKFKEYFIKSVTSFVYGYSKVVIFCCERGIENKNRVWSSFADGKFWAIEVETSILFKIYFFLFVFAHGIEHFEKCTFCRRSILIIFFISSESLKAIVWNMDALRLWAVEEGIIFVLETCGAIVCRSMRKGGWFSSRNILRKVLVIRLNECWFGVKRQRRRRKKNRCF